MDDFDESYMGNWNDTKDFAKEICEDQYGESIEQLPWFIQNAINWDVVWDNMSVDYFEEDFHIFRRC
jgi:hypothetical protein